MLSGRSPAVKAALARDLTDVVARHTGAAAEHVQVLIVEHDPHHWAQAGQLLAGGTGGGEAGDDRSA
jgi:phenylpyruvate tautomerase PptA (4-oxalocrotonate tautomerase family)